MQQMSVVQTAQQTLPEASQSYQLAKSALSNWYLLPFTDKFKPRQLVRLQSQNINHHIIESISISMSRKQAIIRLGRSKSPSRLRKGSESSLHRTESGASSKDKDPLHDTTSILNQSMHVSPSQTRMPKNQQVHLVKTHSGFFPPAPHTVQQRVVIKENVRSPVKAAVGESPHRVIVINQGSLHNSTSSSLTSSVNLVNAQVIQPSEREKQLLRKMTVLEARVQQLHQEKQVCVVRAHDQNSRLVMEMNMLRNRLQSVECGKNNQIAYLRNQLQKVKQINPMSNNIRPEVIQAQSNPVTINNAAYTDEDDGESSIRNHTILPASTNQDTAQQSQAKQLRQENRSLKAKISQLELQNSRLESELLEMKEAVLKTTQIIQQNNNKIVQNYEEKLSVLEQELSHFRAQAQGQGEASQQLKSKQYECQSLKKHLKQTLDLLRQQNIERDNGQNQFVAKISQLATQLNEKQAKIDQAELRVRELQDRLLTQSKASSGAESCRKCSQLIKTLVKLSNRSPGLVS